MLIEIPPRGRPKRSKFRESILEAYAFLKGNGCSVLAKDIVQYLKTKKVKVSRSSVQRILAAERDKQKAETPTGSGHDETTDLIEYCINDTSTSSAQGVTQTQDQEN